MSLYLFHLQTPDASIQKAILASEISLPKGDPQISVQQHCNLSCCCNLSSTPKRIIQLEILVTNEYPRGRKYFVPHGDPGLEWIRTYLRADNTSDILKADEIIEYNGKIFASIK